MFTLTWRKYLPVIILLMKRSDKAEQVLNMNYTDFARATAGKKIKTTFLKMQPNKGRNNLENKYLPVATELNPCLQENQQSGSLMRDKQFEFSMNSDFQLTIRNNTLVNADN